MYVCMYAWETKVLKQRRVRLYVWGDFGIHAKSSTWEGGKYTHSVIAMNVFLLCSPMLAVVSISTWRARESESCPAGSQNARERKLLKAQII